MVTAAVSLRAPREIQHGALLSFQIHIRFQNELFPVVMNCTSISYLQPLFIWLACISFIRFIDQGISITMKYLELAGRILFSTLFIASYFVDVLGDPSSYAFTLSTPALLSVAALVGVAIFLGGLSILFGYKTRVGAWIIILLLLPISFYLHAFWKITDPLQRQSHMIHLFKDISIIGGALLIAYAGPGPLSIDGAIARRRKQ